jgi:hypothetical protein
MLSSATATPAMLVITPRLCVQRVDGDQSLCAADGLGQWDGHDQYIPSMTASPSNVSTGLTSLIESPTWPSGPATRVTVSRSRVLGT